MVSEDTKNVLIATLIPGSAYVVGMAAFAQDEALMKWFMNDLKFPSWAPRSMVPYMIGDLVTMAPIGCASYLVYKHGGGFENAETKTALAVYGGSFLMASVAGMAIMKKKCLKGMFAVSACTTVGLGTTAYLFFKIHPMAGKLMIPLCLWSAFGTFFMHQLAQLNEGEEEKPTE